MDFNLTQTTENKTMDLTPYYQGSDRRLFQQVNPSLAGMPERVEAQEIETMEQATASIIRNMGESVEKLDDIKNKGNLSSAANEVYNLTGEYDKFVLDNPFAFEKQAKLADKIAGKIRGISKEFTNDEYSSHFESWKKDTVDKFLIGSAKEIKRSEKQASKSGWEDQINTLIDKGNLEEVESVIEQGRGVFGPDESIDRMKFVANNKINTKVQEKQEDELEGLSLSDPESAKKAIESRKYNRVSPQVMEKSKENVRRYMASISPREAVTEESKKKVARGESVPERSSLRYGATEKEYRWNKNFTTTGTYKKDVKEILTEFSKSLDSMEFPDTDAKAKQIGDDMVKRWGRYSSALRVTEDQMRLLVDDKLNSIRGKIHLGNRNDIDLIAQSLPEGVWFPKQIKKIEGEDKDDPDRQKFQQELQGSKDFITAKVKTAMTEYRITNPKASLSDDKSHMLYLFAKYTQESFDQWNGDDWNMATRSLDPNIKETKKEGYYKNKGEEFNQGMIDKGITDTVEKDLIPEKQNEKNANYIKEQIPAQAGREETAPQICPISYSRGTGGKEGVYVSKQAWETLHKRFGGNPWVKVELESGQPGFAKGAYSHVPVLGFYEGNDRGIEIRGEETSKRLIMFDGDKGRAKFRFLQGEEGGAREASTLGSQASAKIISNEARFDKKGNLAIYKLPDGDGGGEYEIVGINQKNHSQEFNKLAGMLKDGKHQEAKEEAASYIDKKTSRVGELLQSSGVQHDGIDYLLRDMCFNGGESFPARVIHRSLGIPDSKSFNGDTGEAISSYLQSHSEEELLAVLKQGRDDLYRSIATNNPKKQKFLRGWLNRSESSYKEAMQMA